MVHVGTAEFGHYYSYISTSRGDPSKRDPKKKDKWLEFNDSTIRDFNTDHIESECFGGAQEGGNDDGWGFMKAGKDNSKNAYILVYERVTKDPLKLRVPDAKDEDYLKRVFDVDRCLAENKESVKFQEEEIADGDGKKTVKNMLIDYYNLKRFVPANIYKKVWEDNHKFMFERHIYNDEFFKFINDVCNILKLPQMP